MNQVSSSFPSFDDEWAGDAGVTDHYNLDCRDDADDDWYPDECDEFGDNDGEWIHRHPIDIHRRRKHCKHQRKEKEGARII